MVGSFFGFAGYYRRFVMEFPNIAVSLTKLTWKEEKFVWTEDCENSFQELEKKLTSASILTLPLKVNL